MGRVVVKAARDRDQYVIWSSVVSAPVFGPGTRQEVTRYLLDKERIRYTPAEVEEILSHVDRNGSSDRSLRFAGWGADPLPVGEGSAGDGWYELPRDRLAAYADALAAGDDEAARALLVCFHRIGDDEEV